jgi:hypothetical protein
MKQLIKESAIIFLIVIAFILSIFMTSCEDPKQRIPSIADEVIKYSGNYEIINDSIAILKDGKANRDFIYKKNTLNNRWKRVI